MNQLFPILLAEDHPTTRKVLEKTLIKAGHKVSSVENGRQALELFKQKFFPIVLSDWMMPEMTGLELCRAIRKNASDGYVFIVLLTSKDSKDDIVLGLEAGADDYLTKPTHPAELLARIKTGMRILELERSLKKANKEIRALSITDPLTGAYNRNYLNERLPK
jgi:PleD family two-component response regulator